ncbi:MULTISPECIES: dipeptide/oligopeptide/nickel ABC transporter permease/ATP-binding protein [unclassified Streptomyces]|uniref:dipeptide/oligopeptide/nickel ABC transporter permease/ATP-binding protein n=1 Tax=unclassified Streptomyces TaxID=2593676 RepID=UPI001487B174|nr:MULTISPECIES: dipeptide/oligopeptide/nickel ABC transporter permease/ATP-binding protein [unclassified Streptomyces]
MTVTEKTAAPGTTESAQPRRRSRHGLLHRLLRQPGTVIGIGVLLLAILIAVAAPLLAPHDPTAHNYDAVLAGPGGEHWLGTDDLGRDTLSRLLYGARIALLVSAGAVGIAMVIGVPIGLLLGYRGGWTDRLGSRLLDVSDALPGIMVGFAVIAILGRGLMSLMLAVGLIFCMSFARLTRAVTLAERERQYVESAQVAGLRTPEILFRHVLPNLTGPLAVQAAGFLGHAVVIESVLSFLGLGLESDTASWGAMLSLAAEHQAEQPFLAFPPGVAIVVTVLAFNVISDGINDALMGVGRASVSRRFRGSLKPAPAPATDGDPPADGTADDDAVLAVRNVTVALDGRDGPVPLVKDASLTLRDGEVLGLLGESGSGKSILSRSVLGLLPRGIHLTEGSVRLGGEEISRLGEKDLRKYRGSGISVVLQDPMTALSPVHTVGRQLCEPLRLHFGMSKEQARTRAVELLTRVGVRDAEGRLDDYPHQFSGGMAQRVAIAMALAAGPKVLIADEATSALDVTTQSQVLDLLLELRDEFHMSIVLITHDLGVVAETCDRVAVMYAGQIVEVSEVSDVLHRPRHPYTAALMASSPSGEVTGGRLATIPGQVPPAGSWPVGCHFADRCSFAEDGCRHQPVRLEEDVRCTRAEQLVLEVSKP